MQINSEKLISPTDISAAKNGIERDNCQQARLREAALDAIERDNRKQARLREAALFHLNSAMLQTIAERELKKHQLGIPLVSQ